jgi:KipI family sensor histidine kinase inhibitor
VPSIELCGDDLLSIDVDSPSDAQALAQQLRASGNWLEVVPGIASVVVQFDAAETAIESANREVAGVLALGSLPLEPVDELFEIPVAYGGEAGPDFEEVCAQTGLSPSELIQLHTGSEFRVDLVGFTPGFVYVGGLDEALNVPRRAEPRQRVAAGSVGIADGRTGLYALSGPGGWPLIGRTNFKLFEPDSSNPFPIRAGARIRFVAENKTASES